MAPIRRYLRLTPHTTLELRIYLDNPSLASTWLLHPSPPASLAPSPVLPRIIAAIRPYVLPKLREENERVKGKGKKAKGVKDTVSGDDFEVSMFLTDMEKAGCRHSVLKRDRVDRGKLKGGSGVRRREGKLTGWLTGGDEEGTTEGDAVVIREESDDEENGVGAMSLHDYPEAGEGAEEEQEHRKKRRRRNESNAENDAIDISSDEGFADSQPPSSKRRRDNDGGGEENEDKVVSDDKKDLGLQTQYDGYAIYGHILCLIVKKRGGGGTKGKVPGAQTSETGRQMLETWVSTQAAQEGLTVDE